MKKRQHAGTFVWLSRTIGKKKWCVFFLTLLQILIALSGIYSALIFRSLVNYAMDGDGAGFFRAAVGIAALMAGRMVLNAIGNYLYEWTRATMENQLKKKLFSCLLRKDYSSVTAVHSGEWMNRLTSDTVVVVSDIVDIIPGLTGMATRLLGALAVLFILEPIFVTLLLPGGGVILLFTYGFRKILKRLHKRIQELDGALRIFMQERLENLMIVRTFSMEKGTEQTVTEKMCDHKAARIRRNHLSNLCSVAFGTAANGFYLFGAIYCGYGILRGELSYGTMIAVLQLIGQVQAPFASLTGYLPRYYAMIASAERLMEAEEFQEDCEKDFISEQEILRFYQEEFQSFGLRKADFTYQILERRKDDEGKEVKSPIVLKAVDLDIRKGEYVAFTGRSGCGKSTILKLLMSLYPLDGGERYINGQIVGDGKNACMAEQPLTARWRGMFAYVPQGNQLMSGTIREVMAFGDPKRMQEEALLHQALQIACAEEFVDTLEKGMDTLLGERGSGLSEGQMQRIAIARAIFSGHPILLLDESTSALDEVTEQRLLANLKAMTDRTVLIVTHRASVLGICDKQITMTEEGNLLVIESRAMI